MPACGVMRGDMVTCRGEGCVLWRWKWTSRRVLYEEGDGFEALPRDEWQGYCAVGGHRDIPEPSRLDASIEGFSVALAKARAEDFVREAVEATK
jgi:hypothetical protein